MKQFCFATVLLVIWTIPALGFECKENDPSGNALCSDYCRSLNHGNHVAGICAKDEFSCLCETKNNKTVKVRVLQDQTPKPHPVKPPQLVYSEVVKPDAVASVNTVTEPVRTYRAPQGPQAQTLVCDGSPIATATCNAFCVEVVNGSSGICNMKDQTCRCKDVQFIKKEPIQAMYIPNPHPNAVKPQKPSQVSKPPMQNLVPETPPGLSSQNQIINHPQRFHPQSLSQNGVRSHIPQSLPHNVAAESPIGLRPPGSVLMKPQMIDPQQPWQTLEKPSPGVNSQPATQILDQQPRPQPPVSDQPLQGSHPPQLQKPASEQEIPSSSVPGNSTVVPQNQTSEKPVPTPAEFIEFPKQPFQQAPVHPHMQMPPQAFYGTPHTAGIPGQTPQNFRPLLPPPGQVWQHPPQQPPLNQPSQFPQNMPQGAMKYPPQQFNQIPASGPPQYFNPFFQPRPPMFFQQQRATQFLQRPQNFLNQPYFYQQQNMPPRNPQLQSSFNTGSSLQPLNSTNATFPISSERTLLQPGGKNTTMTPLIEPKHKDSDSGTESMETTTGFSESTEGDSTATEEITTTSTTTVRNTGLFSAPPLEYGFKGIPSRTRAQKRVHHDLLTRRPKCDPDDCRQSCIAKGYSSCIPLCMPQGCHCSCAQASDNKYILQPIDDS